MAAVSTTDPIHPPSPFLIPLEGRAWFELAGMMAAVPLLRGAPAGDGHPVLVLPGFLASDTSTRALRWFLRDRGYRVHGWRLGRNLGPTPECVQGIGKCFLDLRERYGRPVTLLGWSLGGIYARELARSFPDGVRQVITLATPFRDVAATTVARLGRLGIGPRPSLDPGDWIERLRAPLPVPTTSVYSRSDGIVAWRSCLEEPGPRRENVEVRSSHIGMGHNAAALLVIADRLAQAEGTWQPFVPSGWTEWQLLRAWV